MMNLKRLLAISLVFLLTNGISLAQACTPYGPKTRSDVIPHTTARYQQHFEANGYKENMCPPSGSDTSNSGPPAGPAGCKPYSSRTDTNGYPGGDIAHYNDHGHKPNENMCPPSGSDTTNGGTPAGPPAGPAGCRPYSSRTDTNGYPGGDIAHYNDHGHKPNENMCPPEGGSATQPAPGPTGNIPFGNWAYIDDSVLSLDGQIIGDPNSSQDLAVVLALAVHFNSLPRFIGVTQVRGKLGTSVVQEIVRLSGLSIPVINGAATSGSVSSPLSKEIAKYANSGKFALAVGGTTGDVAAAVRALNANGLKNLTTYITRYTWNEENSEGATAFVIARVKNVSTPKSYLFYMLGTKNGPKLKVLGQTPKQWMDSHGNLPMFNRAFSAAIVAESKRLNTFMSSFENENPLRMADWHHAAAIFNVNPAPSDQHWKIINRGLNLMK